MLLSGKRGRIMNVAILFSSLTLFVFGVHQTALADPLADEMFASAKETRKQLPMKVDEMTTWLTVGTAGRMMVYSYRLEAEGKMISPSFAEKQEATLKYNLCASSIMSKMMKRGALYTYIYKDIRDRLITEITVSNSDC